MKLRPMAVLVTLSLVTACADGARADEAKGSEYLRFAGSVDGGHMIPTSSTKQLVVDLQLLFPIDGTRRLFAGIGPRALTRELLTSTLPEVLSVGLTSSLSAQF